MHVISERRLRDFWTRYPDAEKPLRVWHRAMEAAAFDSPAPVKQQYPSVSFLANDVTIFNIGGNKYRLSVNIRYRARRIYIRHVMTHEEYDERTAEGTL